MSPLPPTNFNLNAAVAALNAQPYPWFTPYYSIRLSDQASYDLLNQGYGGFGTFAIVGLSPQQASTLLGIPVVIATTEAMTEIRPCILVFPQALNVLGVPISINESGGTIAISYASPFGRFDRVIWEWCCEVTYDPAVVPAEGGWSQDVVTWDGDGTTGRLIATAFPLDVGTVAIWIFVQPNTALLNCFRHNAMAGTTGAFSPAATTGGIMSFTAAGFTVQDSSPGENTFPNSVGQSYTAVVLQDTTTDARYLHVGEYHGRSDIVTSGTFTFGSGIVTCGTFGPYDVGRGIQSPALIEPSNPGGFNVIAGIIDADHFAMFNASPASLEDEIFAAGGNRGVYSGSTFPLTQVWVFGRATGACAFCSDDFAPPNSTPFALEAKALTDEIIALGTSVFEVGTDNNVNDGSLIYYFAAFSIPIGDPIRSTFATYKATGAGAPLTVSLAFTPVVATARPFVAGIPESVWRGPLHAGTTSANFDGTGNAADGITDMSADTITLAAAVAASATDVYGFALSGTSIAPAVDPTPPYNPNVIPPGAYTPSGALFGLGSQGLGTGQLGPCGCPLEMP